ncbi:MAG: ATP-binding protein [bacterium]
MDHRRKRALLIDWFRGHTYNCCDVAKGPKEKGRGHEDETLKEQASLGRDGARGDARSAGLHTPAQPAQDHIKEYYRRLRRELQVGIMLALIVPTVITNIYFNFQFNNTLKKSSESHLVTVAESQRNTIDLFLQERVVNVYNQFRSKDFKFSPTQEDMRMYLESLLRRSDAFVDVGFLDETGLQIGYAGPYIELIGRNYHDEAWFRNLMEDEKDYYISDIYLGFRKKPHFTIAVKQYIGGQYFIVRATLDPDKFYLFLRTITRGKGVDSAIINKDGLYQVVDPEYGGALDASKLVPPGNEGSGAFETLAEDGPHLVAYAWLKEAPWALVVRQPLRIAYAGMYRARKILIVATVAIMIILFAAVWFTTERLLGRAEAVDEERKEIKQELFHAARLASVGELAAGVAHEINNPLQVISSQSGLIKDMLDPQFGMAHEREDLVKELDVIDDAVGRARLITTKLLDFTRKKEPELVDSNINELFDDCVSGIKAKEFEVNEIELVRDYDPNLPPVLVEPNQIKQVFLNLINNAGDAIECGGRITIKTRSEGNCVMATITDTGCGMTQEQLSHIFVPFFTTKEVGKGTGLGLSVSLSIVETMGGKIEVQSVPGQGSSFTVTLPVDLNAAAECAAPETEPDSKENEGE